MSRIMIQKIDDASKGCPQTKGGGGGGLTRRRFLKASGVAAGAMGITGALTKDEWLVPAGASELADAKEKICYSYHPTNCGNRCSLVCTVRDGRLVHIKGNQWSGPEECFSTCCLRGMSEVQRVYSPDRIQTPLKRTGERGSGEFEAISWDEALSTVADKIKETQDKYGKASLFVPYSSGVAYSLPLLRKLTCAQAACESGIDMGHANGFNPLLGTTNAGQTRASTFNWVHSKTIILVGNNIIETGVTDAQLLMNAQEAGAKLIVVDPVHTATAAKADQWISLRPGTDPALYLGMASVILDNEWYDEDFLNAHTSAPFLVSAKDGSLLRVNAEVSEDDTGKTNPYLVWDAATNSAKPYNAEGVQPALEGSFEIEGVEASTVFKLLKENQREYTADWASKTTGIEADVIRGLAEAYAKDTPAFLGMGFGGADKFSTADIAGHAAGVLAALTGNIGQPGTGVGIVCNHNAAYSVKMGSWALPKEFKETELEMQSPLFKSQPNSMRMVLNIGNALVQHMGNFKTTREWLAGLDFVVTIDPFHNDSTNWSDIVLPSCTTFEMREESGMVTTHKNHLLQQQKVIEPLFDSKTDFEIEHELCERLGFGEYLPSSMVEYTKALIKPLENITYDELMKNKGIMRLNVPEEPFDEHAGQKYKTPSGRIEIYNDVLVGEGQALPTYEQLLEAYEGNPLAEKYPLTFIQPRRRYRVHSQFYNSTWINQIDSGPKVELHPSEAEARGLATGDTARLFNDRGSVEVTCSVNEAIRPGMLSMCEGSWMRDTNGASYQDLVNETLIERGKRLENGAPIPFYDTLVQIEKA